MESPKGVAELEMTLKQMQPEEQNKVRQAKKAQLFVVLAQFY